MLIGERVSERLQESDLSQAELARRVGISQQAIGKLIHGNSRSSAHLHRIARELGTTPAYLEGETDDPNEDAPAAPEFDSDTRSLVEKFGQLTPTQRKLIQGLADELIGGHPSGTVHAPKRPYGRPPNDGHERRQR